MEDEESRLSNLPLDLIASILGRLSFPDFFRSRAVCRQWSQVLMSNYNPITSSSSDHHQPRNFPFLILSSEHGEQSQSCTLLSLPERRLYHLSPLPEILNRHFIGSNGNWLVTLNLALEPRLLNPFTREEAPLPSLIPNPLLTVGLDHPNNHDVAEQNLFAYPIYLFLDLSIQKIVPSSHNNNGPPDFVVVAFDHSCTLLLARPGDCGWTLVILPISFNTNNDVSDVVHNAEDGMFYVVTQSVEVMAFHPDNPEDITLIFKGFDYSFRSKAYLVFSSDDLLVVHRFRRLTDCIEWSGTSSSGCIDQSIMRKRWTHLFVVCKINRQREGGESTFCMWTHLKHLNGRCLMLGSNHSVSLAPEQVSGLKGNCIYFTDDYSDNLSGDYKDHPRDVGVFDMEFGTIDRFLPDYSSHTWPPPIWFLPSVLHMY